MKKAFLLFLALWLVPCFGMEKDINPPRSKPNEITIQFEDNTIQLTQSQVLVLKSLSRTFADLMEDLEKAGENAFSSHLSYEKGFKFILDNLSQFAILRKKVSPRTLEKLQNNIKQLSSENRQYLKNTLEYLDFPNINGLQIESLSDTGQYEETGPKDKKTIISLITDYINSSELNYTHSTHSNPYDIAKSNTLKNLPNKFKHFEYIPSQEDRRFLKKILEEAPEEIIETLENEKRPEDYLPRTPMLILVGKPGTGKSTLAKAFAVELGTCFVFGGAEISGKDRNQTSETLKDLIEAIISTGQKTTLIIDEIDKLTENWKSTSTDTGMTSALLWSILDKYKDHYNFFIIGTSNTARAFPPPLHERLLHEMVELPQPTVEARIRGITLLLSKLKKPHQLSDEYIQKLAENEDRNYRQINRAIEKARKTASPYPITADHFEKAINLIEKKEKNWGYKEPLSDEDRRHQESLKLQRLQFAHQMEVQRQHNVRQQEIQSEQHVQTLTQSDLHFIQQLKSNLETQRAIVSVSGSTSATGSLSLMGPSGSATVGGGATMNIVNVEKILKMALLPSQWAMYKMLYSDHSDPSELTAFLETVERVQTSFLVERRRAHLQREQEQRPEE